MMGQSLKTFELFWENNIFDTFYYSWNSKTGFNKQKIEDDESDDGRWWADLKKHLNFSGKITFLTCFTTRETPKHVSTNKRLKMMSPMMEDDGPIFKNIWTFLRKQYFLHVLLLVKLQNQFQQLFGFTSERDRHRHTHTQTDGQTDTHHQIWGSPTQKALRAINWF